MAGRQRERCRVSSEGRDMGKSREMKGGITLPNKDVGSESETDTERRGGVRVGYHWTSREKESDTALVTDE